MLRQNLIPERSFPSGCYTLLNPSENPSRLSEQKPENRTYFNYDLRIKSYNGTNSQFRSPQTATKARKFKPFWQKLSEKNETKKRLVKLLNKLNECVLSANFQTCHSKFQSLTCGQHIAERVVNFYCGHRACPFCSAIRSQRIFNNYLPKAEAFFQTNSNATPVHFVLTQKHYKNESLSDSIKRLLGNFRKLIRRKFWLEHLDFGGMYAVEFTIGKDGNWHAHLHIFAFRRRFFHVSKFRSLWKEITGDSVNFKITKIDTIAGGLKEVVKYISKPLDVKDFKPHHLQQVLDLKAMRLFSTFGQFRAFSAAFEPEPDQPSSEASKACPGEACEHCGETLHVISLPMTEQIAFERNLAEARRTARLLTRGSPNSFP